jgi:hypothetical protein
MMLAGNASMTSCANVIQAPEASSGPPPGAME